MSMSSVLLCSMVFVQYFHSALSLSIIGRTTDLIRNKRNSNDQTDEDQILNAVQSKCTVNCTDLIDRTMEKLSINSKKIGRDILDRYNEKDLDQICQGYVNGSKCLKSCPDRELLKPYSQQIFQPLEFLCLNNRKDVQKNMPCIDQQSSSFDKTCDPKCKSYSKSFNDLDSIDFDNLSNQKLLDIEKMFNNSCRFMTCQKDCEKSLILKSCSKDAADFTEKLYSSLFTMIGGFVNMVNLIRDENATIAVNADCVRN